MRVSLCQQLQQALLSRSRDPAADLRARIAAAHALGELGDPRFQQCQGPQGVYLKPPLVPIKGGVYTIGSDEGLYDDEAPAHTVKIAGFSLAQFPLPSGVASNRQAVTRTNGGGKAQRRSAGGAARARRRVRNSSGVKTAKG